MKIRDIIIFVVIITITLFNIYVFYESKKNVFISTEDSMLDYLVSTYTYETQKVDNPFVYYGNDSLNKFNLLDLNKATLVFRFSGNDCNSCVDFIIEKLKEHFKDYSDNSRIILLGSDINPRLTNGYYGKDILNLCNNGLGLDIEKSYIPFLMILDKDNISKMFFIPDKRYPKLTDHYLEIVKKRFLE